MREASALTTVVALVLGGLAGSACAPTGVSVDLPFTSVLEGELWVEHFDNDDGTPSVVYILEEAETGERLTLSLAQSDALDAGLAGRWVEVTGYRFGDHIDDARIVPLDDGMALTATQIAANSLGEQRTLVVLVAFANAPASYTVEEARAAVFDRLDAFFVENSFGQTWFTGDVAGPFVLGLQCVNDSVVLTPEQVAAGVKHCTATEIGWAADQAARQAGFAPESYARIMYAWKSNLMFWSGSGGAGALPTRLHLDGSLTHAGTPEHEMGHCLGVGHAAAWECSASVGPTGTDGAGAGCTVYEYGDVFDVMGNTTSMHMNAAMKEALGFLDFGASPPIQRVTASGTFTLEAYAAQAGGIKALKILRGLDAATGARNFYYVEARRPLGFDAGSPSGSLQVFQGLTIRVATEHESGRGYNRSYLIDPTPESSTYYDWQDATVAAGGSFYDARIGVRLALVAMDASTSTVQVTFDSAPIADTTPPTQPQGLSYRLPSCVEAELSWNAATDSGSGVWGYKLYRTYGGEIAWFVQAVQGTRLIVDVSVQTIYTYSIAALDNQGNESARSGTVSFIPATCGGGDVVAPTVSLVSPTSGAVVAASSTVTIAAEAQDDTGVAKVEFLVDGRLLCRDQLAPFTCAWSVPKSKGRTFALAAVAYDAAGNTSSATASVSTAASTGGGRVRPAK